MHKGHEVKQDFIKKCVTLLLETQTVTWGVCCEGGNKGSFSPISIY